MELVAGAVLGLPLFHTSTIRAGENFIKTNKIEWISVIETPVENFIRQNEFVLTTGIGCHNEPEKLVAFVKDVIHSGASVLGFATGRFIFDIPASIVKVADQSGLVIVDIPWEVRFGDIVGKVMQLIMSDKLAQREEAELARQQLTNCVLNEKGLQDILQTLSKFVAFPTAITDNQSKLRARQNFSPDWFNETKLSEGTVSKMNRDETEAPNPLFHFIQVYNDHKKSIYQLAIINNHKTQGYLYIEANEYQLTWYAMNVLEHALTACALYFVKENAIELTEVRIKDNFVMQLAKQAQQTDQKLITKADMLGYDLTVPYICLVGHIAYKELPSFDNDRSENSSLHSQNYAIQKEITYAGELFEVNTMTTFEEGRVILFLESELDSYVEIVHSFLDKVERRMSELLKGIKITWGIAAPKSNPFSFSVLYSNAVLALRIGGSKQAVGSRTLYEDTKMDRLLMALAEEEEVRTIVNETLRVLLAYDNKRQTDLLHTFFIYKQHNGNVSQAARELNLHRQSLLHRLRNIEALTNLSLIDPDDAFLLELTSRIWKLQQLEEYDKG
ncbi:purine catabolism regulatory protein [Paraliobacillus ryukyuensis]|uniref:Purine catabolism regulator n=1 Tax=Paraliobacillus ryukyuensis TaxID=200904 RepID=A0A366EEA4_9BACI|nr:PucR family transcriptional regulator [Paraliobacillus ryukyuensis]RBP00356.1 purine catabolism regulator [Paraliobacillus ryukyuensis]